MNIYVLNILMLYITRDFKICVWGSARQKARITRSQRDAYLSYLNNSCRFFLIPIISVPIISVHRIHMQIVWFIDNVIPSTSSSCIARIVHYILYTIRAAVHSDIQSILLLSARPLLSYILLIPLTVLSHASAYIISQNSAIPTYFSFRRTLHVAKKKMFFNIILNN